MLGFKYCFWWDHHKRVYTNQKMSFILLHVLLLWSCWALLWINLMASLFPVRKTANPLVSKLCQKELFQLLQTWKLIRYGDLSLRMCVELALIIYFPFITNPTLSLHWKYIDDDGMTSYQDYFSWFIWKKFWVLSGFLH